MLLVRLNTPGGLLSASREVVEELIASPAPVVTWVAPSGARAASAGFFLLLAGDVAAMAPGTHTGAASPVVLGRELDPIMRRKIESDAGAWLRSIASRRGRNATLAEKAVTEAKSFTEQEALDSNLINLIAKDETELLSRLDGTVITRFDGTKQTLAIRDAKVFIYQLSLRQKILKAVSDPNVALVVLLLGVLGLYIEFSTPGLIFPGVAGAILLLLGLTAIALIPLNWLGVSLILLALALFVLEAKFTSFGILGAGGTAAMILGTLFLVEGPPEFRVSLGTAIGISLPFAAIYCIPDDARYPCSWKQNRNRSKCAGGRDRHCPDYTRSRGKDIRPRRILGRSQFSHRRRRNTGSRVIGGRYARESGTSRVTPEQGGS